MVCRFFIHLFIISILFCEKSLSFDEYDLDKSVKTMLNDYFGSREIKNCQWVYFEDGNKNHLFYHECKEKIDSPSHRVINTYAIEDRNLNIIFLGGIERKNNKQRRIQIKNIHFTSSCGIDDRSTNKTCTIDTIVIETRN